MILLKRLLHGLAWLCRMIRALCDHWIIVAVVLCILSPISPHVRIPYALAYTDCDYIGTRGVINVTDIDCPPVAIINTRNSEVVSW